MYYVAPQVWASRQGRIRQIRAYVDRLACIFPFEQEYFCSRGVHATFVGHPLFDQLPRDRARGSGPRFPGAPPVVGVVPGSRRSEVTANLPRLIQVMQIVQSAFQNVTFLIPTTPAVDSIVRQTLEPFALNKVIEENGFDAMMRSCDLCLCKSGTSTLHVAAWGVPMIVFYHVSPILWHMLGRWMVKTRKIAMVNILAGQRDLVSEFIPFSDPQAVANCALDLLNHPGKLEAQRAELKELIAPLDKPGASANAARVAIELMEGKR
jgi:lipid-A-disaccharide synthase